MTLLPEQQDLVLVVVATALMWIPYTVALIARGGLMAAMGNRDKVPALPAWAERARRAHGNAVENLVLFAPLLLLAAAASPGSAAIGAAAHVYLGARIIHYFAYVAGIPVVRTLAFVTGWGATIAIALALLA
ncbi:MAPEG family protein [Edaphosphingomonas haloaromaticamans]|uniref:MAPEG family protein n=1 Tax=Edaphosphingomonas haloaromaticamans TaxID=653954 RepID=A0A1S1HLL8_9SPHN|nr:MAPEG family protein [Sphingomonas haloaromaticamans]OHT22306.1 MAPEG family protein [Sphingomonas haloaromaticamans]